MSKKVSDLINFYSNLANQSDNKSNPNKEIAPKVNLQEMKQAYEEACKTTDKQFQFRPEAIKQELEYIRGLQIVTQRLAEIRDAYVKMEKEAANEVKKIDLAVVKNNLLSKISVIPSKSEWKKVTSVWYAKRGKTLKRLDKSLEDLGAAKKKLPVDDAKAIKLLNTHIMNVTSAVTAWGVRKAGNQVGSDGKVDHSAVKKDRRMKNNEAQELYDNMLNMRDASIKASFALAQKEGYKTHRKALHTQRYSELLTIFEDAQLTDHLTASMKSGYSLVNKSVSFVEDVALLAKDKAVEEVSCAVLSTIDRLGITDAIKGSYCLYKIYKAHEKEEKMKTIKGTSLSLDDDLVPLMIDSMMTEMNWRTTQIKKKAAACLASAAVKAASSGSAAEVGTLITQAQSIEKLITGLVKTFKDSYELHNSLANFKQNNGNEKEAFEATYKNSYLSGYFIRLMTPELLMPPAAFSYYEADTDGFKKLHNTEKATQLMSMMIDLRQVAQTVLMGGFVSLRPLQSKILDETAFEELKNKYNNISLGGTKAISEFGTKKTLKFKRGMNNLEVSINKLIDGK